MIDKFLVLYYMTLPHPLDEFLIFMCLLFKVASYFLFFQLYWDILDYVSSKCTAGIIWLNHHEMITTVGFVNIQYLVKIQNLKSRKQVFLVIRTLRIYFLACAHSLSRGQLFVTLWIVAPRLLCSGDSPGKSTGVSCHFLFQRTFYHWWLSHITYSSSTVNHINHVVYYIPYITLLILSYNWKFVPFDQFN